MKQKKSQTLRRETLRKEYWPKDIHYEGFEGTGYFCAPRTLPLLLCALNSKEISDRKNPSSVYLELLSRHIDEGIVEMVQETEHAFSAGYPGERGRRSWRERMNLLLKFGVIKAVERGGLSFGTVLLVHPTLVFEDLRKKGKVDDAIWNTYLARAIDIKAPNADAIRKKDKEARAAGKLMKPPAYLKGAK